MGEFIISVIFNPYLVRSNKCVNFYLHKFLFHMLDVRCTDLNFTFSRALWAINGESERLTSEISSISVQFGRVKVFWT